MFEKNTKRVNRMIANMFAAASVVVVVLVVCSSIGIFEFGRMYTRILLVSIYLDSANFYEVVYQGRPRLQMFAAYALGFTVEFFVVNAVLYFLVKRADCFYRFRCMDSGGR